MTDRRARELRDELARATPTPWSRYASHSDNAPHEFIFDKLPGYGGKKILEVKRMPDGKWHDHDFVIEAVNALPVLLDARDELLKKLSVAEQHIRVLTEQAVSG